MIEVWKDVPNFEGLYRVSNTGKVKSFAKSNKYATQPIHLLNPTINNNGYAQVTFYKDCKRSKFSVHRLVAELFIPNPDNLPCINHKDENKLNNSVDNLEWCTVAYNNAYGTARIRGIDKRSKPVEQLTYDGKVIAVYRSAKIASEIVGIEKNTITSAILGNHQSEGYYWRYSSVEFPPLPL